jgi:prolyl-tRNA synthetase
MRTRLFLRTAEFLWQEGHTAHATEQEAIAEAEQMMNVYADFAENFLAIPVWKGTKSANERFAGAIETYCIEALMQDGKALQAGTSHFLGQNFAKAFDVKFTGKDGKQNFVWATSWGVSTRLMGALIMTHSDDSGLVLPPNLAPFKVVIVPIYRKEEEYKLVCDRAREIKTQLEAKGITVKLDDRDTHKPGWKFAEYEFKGVPVRIGLGPRDIENGTLEVARRDTLTKESIATDGITEYVESLLAEIQTNLFQKALKHREENTTSVSSWDEFKEVLDKKGGFILAHWDGSSETELKIKEKTKATIRLIPLEDKYKTEGKCVYSGNPSDQIVVFAKAY